MGVVRAVVHWRVVAWIVVCACSVLVMSGPGHAASDGFVSPVAKAHNSEYRLRAAAVYLLRVVESEFPYFAGSGVVYGWREDPVPDHPSGLALDIMVPDDGRSQDGVRTGDNVAAFLMANHKHLSVNYLVWRQRIWYPGQAWRTMNDRGNWTDNHMNHVHVLVNDTRAPAGPLVASDVVRAGIEVSKASAAAQRATAARTAAAEAVAALSARCNQLAVNVNVSAAREQQAKARVGAAARSAYMAGVDTRLLSELMAIDPQSATAMGAGQVALDRVTRDVAAVLDVAADNVASSGDVHRECERRRQDSVAALAAAVAAQQQAARILDVAQLNAGTVSAPRR